MKKLLILFIAIFTLTSVKSQVLKDTTYSLFGSFVKNAYIYYPSGYAANPTKTYPLIIVFPGAGEADGDKTLLLSYGPFKVINDGFVPEFQFADSTVKPIVVTIMLGAFAGFNVVDDAVTRIKSSVRYDPNRVYLWGWSAGGQQTTFMIDYPAAGSNITGIVNYQGVSIGTGGAHLMGTNFADLGGKAWMIEGISDPRDLEMIKDSMNVHVSGSGRYTLISSGSGSTHSGAGFDRTADSTYKPNGDGLSPWTWLLRQTRATIPPATPTITTRTYYRLRKNP